MKRQTNRPFIAWEFKPEKKKSFFTLFRVGILSIILTIPLILLLEPAKPYYAVSIILKVSIGLLLFVFFATRIGSSVALEPLNGIIRSRIIFKSTGIEVNKTFYDFENINEIEISINHYYQESLMKINSLDPNLSNGVDNKITFKYKDSLINAFFQINSKSHLLNFIDYLKSVDIYNNMNVSYKGKYFRIKEFDIKKNIPFSL